MKFSYLRHNVLNSAVQYCGMGSKFMCLVSTHTHTNVRVMVKMTTHV